MLAWQVYTFIHELEFIYYKDAKYIYNMYMICEAINDGAL